jgi:hypothetical protein
MERLTRRSDTGRAYYPRCFEEPCIGAGCKIKDCLLDDIICDRLAAYEDTGLEPEEVLPKDKADEIALKLMRLVDLESICSYTRLRELAEADKDGRVVVLPAKTVFELTWDAGPDCDLICSVSVDGEGCCSFCDKGELCIYERKCRQEHIEEIGKTVFLTREEAEKALEAMK